MTHKTAMSTFRLAVSAITSSIRVHKSGYTVVAIAIAIAIKVQSKVCCGFEILGHCFCCGHMAGECRGIISAESSDCDRNIWPSCKCYVHQ